MVVRCSAVTQPISNTSVREANKEAHPAVAEVSPGQPAGSQLGPQGQRRGEGAVGRFGVVQRPVEQALQPEQLSLRMRIYAFSQNPECEKLPLMKLVIQARNIQT